MFDRVGYLQKDRESEIEILQTTQADIDYVVQRIGNTNKIITVLSSENRKYYVVSSVVKVLENVDDETINKKLIFTSFFTLL